MPRTWGAAQADGLSTLDSRERYSREDGTCVLPVLGTGDRVSVQVSSIDRQRNQIDLMLGDDGAGGTAGSGGKATLLKGSWWMPGRSTSRRTGRGDAMVRTH